MKKLIICVLLLTSIGGYAYKNGDVVAKGLKFLAPSVNGKGKVWKPEAGEIIFDGSDQQFYGMDDNERWIKFSAAEAILPSGVILPFAGTAAPNGYYPCDGRALPILGNEALHDAILNAFGDGTKNADGTASIYPTGGFNLPDMRGRFMRGVDDTAGRDPNKSSTDRPAPNVGGNTGNNVGSVQSDQLKAHNHTFTVGLSGGGTVPANGAGSYTSNTTSTAGGSETRPLNIYVNYIIKQ